MELNRHLAAPGNGKLPAESEAALRRAEVNFDAARQVVELYAQRDGEAQAELEEAQRAVEEWPMRGKV